MSNVPSENLAYDLVVSFPVMEFAARVARRGKYSAPIIDEFVIRVVHAAGDISVSSIGGLLRLTGAQLESFMEPMLRSGLLAFTDAGTLTLGPQGQQAMMQASGEPPKLSRVEEATELCAVDVFDHTFAFKPSDRRTPARLLEVAPAESSDRAVIREHVREDLLVDYFHHQQYLEVYGLRAASPKQIEYVIDLDDGWGDRMELSLRVLLDDRGVPIIDYPDLRSAEQLQKRRALLGHIDAALSVLKSSVPTQSQQFFIELAKKAAGELQLDDSLDAIRDREFWVDGGVLVTGRLESRSRQTADGFVDRVITESGLMRGGKERTIKWVVVLIPEPDLFVAGRSYRAFLEGAFVRLRRRSPKVRVIAVTAYPDASRFETTLGPLFQGHVSGFLGHPSLAGVDGIFIPDELAYVACSDVASSRCATSLPRPRNVVTTHLDAVREISRRIFSSPSLAKVSLDGLTDAEWQELSGMLRKMTDTKEARLLKLSRKKPDA
jgi:hypothetical protein